MYAKILGWQVKAWTTQFVRPVVLLLLRILQKDRIVESIYFDTKFEFELLQIHIYGLLLGFNWVSQTQVKDTKSSPFIGGHLLFYLNVSYFGGFLNFHTDTKFKSLSGGSWQIEWLYLAIKKGLGPSPNSRAAKFIALEIALWVILQCSCRTSKVGTQVVR